MDTDHSTGLTMAVRITTSLMILGILVSTGWAQDSTEVQRNVMGGIVSGTVVDAATQQPLPGVSLRVRNSDKGAVSKKDGTYRITGVDVGIVQIEVRLLGYRPRVESDVFVRSGRVTIVNTGLHESSVDMDEVLVTANYFDNGADANVSTVSFNAEELRRSAASVGDLNRALLNLPSVTQPEDEANDLVVRGGSPMENGYYIDGLYTPNINHFPQQGATGGNISIVNMDFVENLTMSAGGFDATYGDRTSAIIDVSFREGNRERLQGQIDLNMTGFGGNIEGPIGNAGSYMVSGRRSYLDAIVALLDVGKAPNFGDVQGKIVFDPGAGHRISALGIYGVSDFKRPKDVAQTEGNSTYGDEGYHVSTSGLTWRALWGESVVTNTALSYSHIDARNTWSSVDRDSLVELTTVNDDVFNLRSVTAWTIADGSHLEGGIEARQRIMRSEDSERPTSQSFDAGWMAGFASFRQRLGRLTLTAGIRGTYSTAMRRWTVDPRFQASYQVSEPFWITASAGVFHQELPPFLLAQDPSNLRRDVPRAMHGIVGVNWLPMPDVKISLEGYVKEYDRFPLSANVPYLFVVDQVAGDVSNYGQYGVFSDSGSAYTRGVELLVQKRLSGHWYGTAGASYFRSRYRDFDGTWRNRTFDNRLVLNLLIGYAPDSAWIFSARFVYAGGKAVTPVDPVASRALGRTVRDVANTNTDYLPAYHSLSLRADKRWYFMGASLTTYLNVVNIYNRKNTKLYYWDIKDQSVEAEPMWGIIPIFGVELEL